MPGDILSSKNAILKQRSPLKFLQLSSWVKVDVRPFEMVLKLSWKSYLLVAMRAEKSVSEGQHTNTTSGISVLLRNEKQAVQTVI